MDLNDAIAKHGAPKAVPLSQLMQQHGGLAGGQENSNVAGLKANLAHNAPYAKPAIDPAAQAEINAGLINPNWQQARKAHGDTLNTIGEWQDALANGGLGNVFKAFVGDTDYQKGIAHSIKNQVWYLAHLKQKIAALPDGADKTEAETAYKEGQADLKALYDKPGFFAHTGAEVGKALFKDLVAVATDPRTAVKWMKQAAGGIKQGVTQHPGEFFKHLAQGVLADPELLLTAGVGDTAEAANAARVTSLAGKAAQVAGRVAEQGAKGGVEGAGLMVPISGLQQTAATGHVNPAALAEAGISGAALGGALGAVGGLVKGAKAPESEPEPVPKPVPEPTADAASVKDRLNDLVPEDVPKPHVRATPDGNFEFSDPTAAEQYAGMLADEHGGDWQTEETRPGWWRPVQQDSVDTLRAQRDAAIQQAHENEVTGLPNRRAFERDVAQAENPVVGVVDLDNFKQVNDAGGHAKGDEHLATIGGLLRQATGGRAYHPHGDEFFVLGDNAADLRQALEAANDAATRATGNGFSFGIGEGEPQAALKQADAAMYANKQDRVAQGLREPSRDTSEPPGGVERRGNRAQPELPPDEKMGAVQPREPSRDSSAAKPKRKALLIRVSDGTWHWETPNEQQLSADFGSRELALNAAPDGYQHLDDGYRPIPELDILRDAVMAQPALVERMAARNDQSFYDPTEGRDVPAPTLYLRTRMPMAKFEQLTVKEVATLFPSVDPADIIPHLEKRVDPASDSQRIQIGFRSKAAQEAAVRDLDGEATPRNIARPASASDAAAMRDQASAQTPSPQLHLQFGHADPKALIAPALIGTGAVVGGMLGGQQGHPIEGALAGAATAVMAPAIAIGVLPAIGRGLARSFREEAGVFDAAKPHLKRWAGDTDVIPLKVNRFKHTLKAAVPDVARRQAIAMYMHGDTSVELSPHEQEVVQAVRETLRKVGEQAQRAGVIDTLMENYLPRRWQPAEDAPQSLKDAFSKGDFSKLSPRTKHALSRTLKPGMEGFEQAKAMGLEPVSLDMADIVGDYLFSVNKALANKKLLTNLKGLRDAAGNVLVTDKPKAGYKALTGALRGQYAHPDIAKALSAVADARFDSQLVNGALAVNFAAKRMTVAMSLFHPKSLVMSHFYSGGSIKGAFLNMVGRSPELKQVLAGQSGDIIEWAIRHGLKITIPEDVGNDIFYRGIDSFSAQLDKYMPPLGAVPKAVKGINRAFDKFTWEWILTGGKLQAFMKQFEVSRLRNDKLHAKNPDKYRLLSHQEVAESVAEMVNDAFGSQHWLRVMLDARTRTGRNIAAELFSPKGRQVMQLALFAPDWTLSNLRILLKSLPYASRNKLIAKMHRSYNARAIFWYFMLGNAVNKIWSGHYIWDNKEPWNIELGDGRTMIFDKQLAEVFDFLSQPGKSILNKLGIAPRTVLELATNQRYISPHHAPPLWPDNASRLQKIIGSAEHIGAKFEPISFQAGFVNPKGDYEVNKGRIENAAAGFFGFPIYQHKVKQTGTRGR